LRPEGPNEDPSDRVREMKDFIYSWARRKGVLT